MIMEETGRLLKESVAYYQTGALPKKGQIVPTSLESVFTGCSDQSNKIIRKLEQVNCSSFLDSKAITTCSIKSIVLMNLRMS